jgi:hypothetical protein
MRIEQDQNTFRISLSIRWGSIYKKQRLFAFIPLLPCAVPPSLKSES